MAPFVERHFELRADAPVDAGAQPSFTVMRRDPTGIVASSNLTPFVGREYELGALQGLLARIQGLSKKEVEKLAKG